MATDTPWGYADHVARRTRGVTFYSTPGHGGFKVSNGKLCRIPLEWRKASFCEQGMSGWFEEDCDWCLVALSFPELFSEKELVAARSTFDSCFSKLNKEM